MNKFLESLNFELNSMNRNQVIAFCAIICENMMPSYKKFFLDEKWGNYTLLTEIIESMYLEARRNSHDFEEFHKKLELLNQVVPNNDEFDSGITSYAFDCCCAIDESIQFILTNDKSHAFNTSTHVFDTVDMFIQEYDDIETDNMQLESLIENNKYMKKEIERQSAIISLLQLKDIVDDDVIRALHNLNKQRGKLIDIDEIY